MIHFEIPKNQSSIIKVIGVGGGGSNAVNYMYNLGIDGVDFIVCNTDSQALAQSPIPNKVQLGPTLTQGLGAGANPEIGMQAGVESIDDITKLLEVNTKMAFVTAGMGGGTGTGAAPIIAEVCRKLNILTVGIVTTPFAYEGNKRLRQAQEGIKRIKDNVDTILIISNDKLRQQYGNLPFTQAFAKADNILATAAKCITDLITVDGKVNLDFNDVQTVMKNGGVAILGSAQAAGENRATIAVEEALSSPLLNDNEIKGAKWILLNITSAPGDFEHTLDELEIIQGYVQQQAGNNCDIILGMGNDPNLNEKLAVTIIATGFEHHEVGAKKAAEENNNNVKSVYSLQTSESAAAPKASEPTKVEDPLAPKLVETNTTTSWNNGSVKTHFNGEEAHTGFNTKTNFNLELPNHQEPIVAPKEETPYLNTNSSNTFELFVKPESEAPIQTTQTNTAEDLMHKYAERPLTDAEIEEKRRFEEQKRALEERAARLRQMSFNLKADMNEVENIPAYQRRNMEINEQTNGSNNDGILSGYSVNPDNNTSSNISSINTFLDGQKPD